MGSSPMRYFDPRRVGSLECRAWETRLAGRARPLVKLDVSERPDLARKYGVAIVPTVVAVAPDGSVVERLAP